MLITQEPHKILEVKIRPFSNQNKQERADQREASRVHLCSDALRELNLVPGQLCYLWKVNDPPEQRREAIIWLTHEKSLSKKVVQMSKTFQEATGFKLGDDLNISAAQNETAKTATTIVLRDITAEESESVPELTEEEKTHWQWYLKENLSRAGEIFAGMTFTNVSLRGPKRTFRVALVDGETTSLGSFDESSCTVKISSCADWMQSPEPLRKLQLSNIAGIDHPLKLLNDFLGQFDRDFKFTWGQRSCAVLLHGGPGTGKTFVLDKVVETGWAKNVIRVQRDDKAETIRSHFKKATLDQPSIVVIDELEALVGMSTAGSKQVSRVLEEELDVLSKTYSGVRLPRVLVIAATDDISLIPMSLRKTGRFFDDISLPIPNATARKAILKSLALPLKPETQDAILDRLADRTHVYTPQDLISLLSRACVIAEQKLYLTATDTTDESLHISLDSLDEALSQVRPTAMHDYTVQPPSVRWDEIGGQDSVKKALRLAVETPFKHHDLVKRIGGTVTKGVLLYGPPGCSKTLSAQAVATEIGFNFFAVKGAELLNMYVGESERAVRNIFRRAKATSPSIIFFDEIESIGSAREGSGRSNGVNVLTTLLNEMDGIETLKGVTVLAATNQPQALDLALLRPGRFDKLLYIGLPDLVGRQEILQIKKRKMDFADDVDIQELARLTDGYSGAELVGICQTACDAVLEKCAATGENLQVRMEDFMNAMKHVKKQITPELILGYERWAVGTGRKGNNNDGLFKFG